jgi:hypothetical protein
MGNPNNPPFPHPGYFPDEDDLIWCRICWRAQFLDNPEGEKEREEHENAHFNRQPESPEEETT